MEVTGSDASFQYDKTSRLRYSIKNQNKMLFCSKLNREHNGECFVLKSQIVIGMRLVIFGKNANFLKIWSLGTYCSTSFMPLSGTWKSSIFLMFIMQVLIQNLSNISMGNLLFPRNNWPIYCHTSHLWSPACHCAQYRKTDQGNGMICSFGSSEQPGQITSRVFKPVSAEGTYLGEILGKGKQKYFRLSYSVFGFRPKIWKCLEMKLLTS